MYFFLQSSSVQRDRAHMQLLHEAMDMSKFWEKSPLSTPLPYITIPVRTFPNTCQRWSVLVSESTCCAGAEGRGTEMWTFDNAVIKR